MIGREGIGLTEGIIVSSANAVTEGTNLLSETKAFVDRRWAPDRPRFVIDGNAYDALLNDGWA